MNGAGETGKSVAGFREVLTGCMGGFIFACVLLLAGCSIPQSYPATQQQRLALGSGDLETYGVTFTTPSTVTGQEEEKQAVALVFARAMHEQRKDIRVLTWDTHDGTIAWEGMQEMLYALEGITEKPITLQVAVERAAKNLVKSLPAAPAAPVGATR